jgi:glutamate synthase domain-containing protein 1
MCGIVGLFFKKKALEPQLGTWFGEMLDCMTSRGPDSAGFAVYGAATAEGTLKYTLYHPQETFAWEKVARAYYENSGTEPSWEQKSTHAVFEFTGEETRIHQFLEEKFADVRVMSLGQRIVIMKEVGLPGRVIERFNVRNMSGSHAIGHTRMATESAVTTQGSHPFSTGPDLCLVHNGSLSNHNRLRRNLEREGLKFATDNDSEVAAAYLTWRMRQGNTLEQALQQSLKDLDGFFTFTVGTRDGFAVLRDPIACKPAVMAETEDYVAMSSEYRSLASLPGIEKAKLWEPEPAQVYSWKVPHE